jgi:hypothetical protein
MIQEYYRQMRKFGCNILAVVQQYDIIKDSAVRGAMIGNSKMFSTVGFDGQEKLTRSVANRANFGTIGLKTVKTASGS